MSNSERNTVNIVGVRPFYTSMLCQTFIVWQSFFIYEIVTAILPIDKILQASDSILNGGERDVCMNYTIKQVKELLFEKGCSDEELHKLSQDKRKGVQTLVKQYEKHRDKKIRLQKQFEEMKTYETHFRKKGKKYIAGIDEAGRGPLAGPVVAAAVILSDEFYLEGLYDSKQLRKADRINFFDYIKEHAVSYGIGFVHSTEIDEINIYEATKLSMQRAINQLHPTPDQLLIDAVKLNGSTTPYESIVKGDQKSVTIAAASILAKVTRDRYMEQLHDEYPDYQFKNNMGYGTKEHIDSIKVNGVTPYHRKTFAPIREVIKQ